MLTAAARSRLAVVLVGARNPQNIGAVARAMHDFGFDDLRVVNPFAPPFEAAQMEASSAVHAGAVMRSARRYSLLPDAIADCGLVAGTTAVGERGLRQPVHCLQDIAPALLEAMMAAGDPPFSQETGQGNRRGTEGKVGLLFGSEKTGLTNHELSFCSLLLTIPLSTPQGRHLSMNLGQAVAVCLYELTRPGFEGSRPLPHVEASSPTVKDRERLLSLTLEMMERSGYARRFPGNARPEIVRHLIAQLGKTVDEAATWMGLFRQLLRALPGEEKSRETPGSV